MANKKYRIQTACPQCGCSGVTALSKEEMKSRYGDLENLELECGECMLKYETARKTACPEWDKECQLQE